VTEKRRTSDYVTQKMIRFFNLLDISFEIKFIEIYVDSINTPYLVIVKCSDLTKLSMFLKFVEERPILK
jgi:hypothetical protein